ncbi:MAG: tRNA pseudouridine(38-40) synthase TruA [Verrucomicrobiota bacterium]
MSPKLKIKLTIAYDGTNYEGWQVQKIGRGVQEVIEEAFTKLFQEHYRLHSSSRTDAGVHARAMIAHVELPREKVRMGIGKIPLALNAQLPPDIRIMSASEASKDFHARFDAKGKQYRYYVYNHPSMDPLLRHYAWHVPQPLNYEAMRKGAELFPGKQDFAAFANNRNYKMESTVRTLTRCTIRKSGPLFTYIIEGDGFLYKMCRGIVGTLVQAGQGRFNVADIQRMLAGKDRCMAGMTAPAHGLVLWKVFY